MIFCREAQYSKQPFTSIGNNIFPNRIMKFQLYRGFIFPDSNYKKGHFNLLFPFLKYIFGIGEE
jgi:hypothetical protein